jgi:hypothetical protein
MCALGNGFADRPQRGQAHHDISELPEIDDEDVARIKLHVYKIS